MTARSGDPRPGRDLGPANHHDYLVHDHRDVQGGAVRAAVFGFSDGLVSNVSLILFMAAAAGGAKEVLTAGIAGLLAGAMSMAAGEYGSVKAQSELVERELEIERESLAGDPDREIDELAAIYTARGIDPAHARDMAEAVMADPEVALEVHAREELGVNPAETGNPIGAAFSSFLAFGTGALFPLVPWLITDGAVAAWASVVIGLVASGAVGVVLAQFTLRPVAQSALRYAGLAAGACIVTYLIGTAFDAAI